MHTLIHRIFHYLLLENTFYLFNLYFRKVSCFRDSNR